MAINPLYRPMLDQITHLFRLETIVEQGSLRRAAERLNVTQPALSRSIVQLEQLFGQPLLERSSRGVQPTPFGRKVLSASLRLKRQWELAEQELREDDTADEVCLRIGAGPVWRAVILPEVMVRMHEAFPKLTFEIYRGQAEKFYEDLSEGRLDVVLAGVGQTSHHSRLVEKRLFTIANHVVARAGHPILRSASKSGVVSVEALLDYPWLVYLEYPVYREITIHAIHERIGHDPDIRLICDSLNTTIRSLQRGDYLAYLPEPIVFAAASPQLVPVPVDLKRRMVDIGMTIREEMVGWEPIRILEDVCTEVLTRYSG